jgi:hypothetical protein
MAEDDGFLSRWARRKAQARTGEPEPLPPVPAPAALAPNVPVPTQAAETAETPEQPPAPPPPTLQEAQALTPEADFRRFVAPEVGPDVRNAALKKLWADPHYNVMDGLDIYIDDYGKPDPLPASMLRQMTQSAFLNLFADEAPSPSDVPATPAAEPPSAATATPDDEDPALRLQPHDEPGPPGVGPGPGEDPGRER